MRSNGRNNEFRLSTMLRVIMCAMVVMLMTFMLGLSVTVRSGAGAEEIDELIEAAHATVDSWATAR